MRLLTNKVKLFLIVILLSQPCLAEDDRVLRQVADEINHEISLYKLDPSNHTLPLVGHWNVGSLPGGYNLDYQLQLLRQGHHILPWLDWPWPDFKWEKPFYS